MTSVVHSQNVHAVRDARNGPNTIDVLEKSTKDTWRKYEVSLQIFEV